VRTGLDLGVLLGVGIVKNLKIAFVVVAFAAATIITLVYGFGDDTADTAESATNWRCVACEHVFQMTAKEVQESLKQCPKPWPPAFCTSCDEREAFRAQQCKICGTWFHGPEVPGWTGKCPKCHPDVEVEPEEEEFFEEESGKRKIKVKSL
jgi:hypothetical protein